MAGEVLTPPQIGGMRISGFPSDRKLVFFPRVHIRERQLVNRAERHAMRSIDGSWRDDSAQSPDVDLHATWLDAPDDLYAVGGNFFVLKNGVIAHYGQPVAGKK